MTPDVWSWPSTTTPKPNAIVELVSRKLTSITEVLQKVKDIANSCPLIYVTQLINGGHFEQFFWEIGTSILRQNDKSAIRMGWILCTYTNIGTIPLFYVSYMLCEIGIRDVYLSNRRSKKRIRSRPQSALWSPPSYTIEWRTLQIGLKSSVLGFLGKKCQEDRDCDEIEQLYRSN